MSDRIGKSIREHEAELEAQVERLRGAADRDNEIIRSQQVKLETAESALTGLRKDYDELTASWDRLHAEKVEAARSLTELRARVERLRAYVDEMGPDDFDEEELRAILSESPPTGVAESAYEEATLDTTPTRADLEREEQRERVANEVRLLLGYEDEPDESLCALFYALADGEDSSELAAMEHPRDRADILSRALREAEEALEDALDGVNSSLTLMREGASPARGRLVDTREELITARRRAREAQR